MELLTILLLLVFLLEEGLKLALLSLKFLKRLGKIRKQFREEKCLSRLTHAQAVPTGIRKPLKAAQSCCSVSL
ncbi:hypothetical protein [Faecalibaculum rodentium]|uniref:hypothetical protein n=1 Tax=Faecalibaculum rodentium TaxID=1702221 RepID=UPI00262CBA60|nr:hypothetical protein [Faecalibaculum rodentium]